MVSLGTVKEPVGISFSLLMMAQMVRNLPAMQETLVWSLSSEDPLEMGMATHFRILVQFCGQMCLLGYSWWSCKEYDRADWLTHTHTHTHTHTDTEVIISLFFVCSYSLRPRGLQLARFPCPSLSLRVCSNSWPLTQWCHPTISSSVPSFSPCPQSFPASGSFPVSQIFASGGQSIGASTSASVHPMNIQDWFPLGWTGWISLLSEGLLRIFSSTTWKHQSFTAQPSLWSNSHIRTWLQERP